MSEPFPSKDQWTNNDHFFHINIVELLVRKVDLYIARTRLSVCPTLFYWEWVHEKNDHKNYILIYAYIFTDFWAIFAMQ